MSKASYRLDWHDEDDACLLEIPTWVERTPRRVAELAAEHYHARGGWEGTWPMTFIIDLDGATYEISVDRDYTPVFSAAKPLDRKATP